MTKSQQIKLLTSVIARLEAQLSRHEDATEYYRKATNDDAETYAKKVAAERCAAWRAGVEHVMNALKLAGVLSDEQLNALGDNVRILSDADIDTILDAW